GSFQMSLQVPTKYTSDSWSLSHVRSDPNSLAETPLSVCPELATPLRAFSISSQNRIDGAIASAILSAWRTLLSDCPTNEPMRAPTSSVRVGRPVAAPRAFANADFPVPGTPSRSEPRGRFRGLLRPGCMSDRKQNVLRA